MLEDVSPATWLLLVLALATAVAIVSLLIPLPEHKPTFEVDPYDGEEHPGRHRDPDDVIDGPTRRLDSADRPIWRSFIDGQ